MKWDIHVAKRIRRGEFETTTHVVEVPDTRSMSDVRSVYAYAHKKYGWPFDMMLAVPHRGSSDYKSKSKKGKRKGDLLIGRPNALGYIASRDRHGKPEGILIERDAEGAFFRSLDGQRIPLPKGVHVYDTLIGAERAARSSTTRRWR